MFFELTIKTKFWPSEFLISHQIITLLQLSSQLLYLIQCYLLTGYDVYLTQEPCLMCSMALVHSRVSRVFFMEPLPQKGGLYSLCRLQNVRSLNHAFEVFQIKPQGAT